MAQLQLIGTVSAAAALLAACQPYPAPPPAPPLTPVAVSFLMSLHHKCYAIRGQAGAGNIDFLSQFSNERGGLGTPLNLCAPVLKQVGEREFGTLSSTYLKCYSIFGSDPDATVSLTSDQFGTEVHEVGPAIAVCAPANKAEAPGRPSQSLPRSPYYTCYLIEGEAPAHPPVTLRTSQFPTRANPIERNVAIGQPRSVCAPSLRNARGNDEEKQRELRRIEAAFPHLKCYQIQGPPSGKRVNLLTIFGAERNVPVLQPQALCAPVTKTVMDSKLPPEVES